MRRTNAIALALATSAGWIIPAQAATFSVNIGSPLGTPSCGSENSGVVGSPVSRELTCSPNIGVVADLSGQAVAAFGHVGGNSRAVVGNGYFGTSFGIGTSSSFSEFVTFTSLDKSARTTSIAANLAFAGLLNSTATASASVDLQYSISGGGTFFFSLND